MISLSHTEIGVVDISNLEVLSCLLGTILLLKIIWLPKHIHVIAQIRIPEDRNHRKNAGVLSNSLIQTSILQDTQGQFRIEV
jgi:hypothetical protein